MTVAVKSAARSAPIPNHPITTMRYPIAIKKIAVFIWS